MHELPVERACRPTILDAGSFAFVAVPRRIQDSRALARVPFNPGVRPLRVVVQGDYRRLPEVAFWPSRRTTAAYSHSLGEGRQRYSTHLGGQTPTVLHEHRQVSIRLAGCPSLPLPHPPAILRFARLSPRGGGQLCTSRRGGRVVESGSAGCLVIGWGWRRSRP